MSAEVRAAGFTGTQVGLTAEQEQTLVSLISRLDPQEAHHGDCIGADLRFHELVRRHLPEARIITHPPTNPVKRAFAEGDAARPPAEYIDRNREIVDESCALIACPKTAVEVLRSGTWATVRYARKRNVPIYLILPDGFLVGPTEVRHG